MPQAIAVLFSQNHASYLCKGAPTADLQNHAVLKNTHISHCLPYLTRYALCYAGSKGLTYKGLMSAPPTCGKRVEWSRVAGERGASRTLESAIRVIVC